jgi:Zn-dependent protease with chaperone function
MTPALWLVTYLLHSTVLIGLLTLFRGPLRRVDRSEFLWRAAVILPLATATAGQLFGFGLWEIDFSLPSTLEVLRAGQGNGETSWVGAASIVCFALGGLLTLRDWFAYRLFVRSLGKRTPADKQVTDLVADLLRSDGVRPLALTYRSGGASPIVLGRREICLPARAAQDLTCIQLRALVAHEVAHVLRRDGFWFTAFSFLESALFVQPLNRIARRELRQLAEISCDEWAAQRVSDRLAMAQCLLEVAGWSKGPRPRMVPAATTVRNGLSERVQRLIGPHVSLIRIPMLPSTLVLSLALAALPDLGTTSDLEVQLSPDYELGYELGRAYAASNSADNQSSQRGDGFSVVRTPKDRRDLERLLMAEQSKVR